MIFETKDYLYVFDADGRARPSAKGYEQLKPLLEEEGLRLSEEPPHLQLRLLSAPCYSAMLFMREGRMGAFASRIAEAWLYADDANRYKIETAFFGLIYRAVKAQRN